VQQVFELERDDFEGWDDPFAVDFGERTKKQVLNLCRWRRAVFLRRWRAISRMLVSRMTPGHQLTSSKGKK
jgi:hypothetical protein